MNRFDYTRPMSVAEAVQAGAGEQVRYLAGGTNLSALMKENVERPVTVVDDLPAARAYAVGTLGGESRDAHAVACARDRGWPLVTAEAHRYAAHDRGNEVEQLP